MHFSAPPPVRVSPDFVYCCPALASEFAFTNQLGARAAEMNLLDPVPCPLSLHNLTVVVAYLEPFVFHLHRHFRGGFAVVDDGLLIADFHFV